MLTPQVLFTYTLVTLQSLEALASTLIPPHSPRACQPFDIAFEVHLPSAGTLRLFNQARDDLQEWTVFRLEPEDASAVLVDSITLNWLAHPELLAYLHGLARGRFGVPLDGPEPVWVRPHA